MVAEDQVVPSSVVRRSAGMGDGVEKKCEELSLKLDKNPLSIFYKDEGGKSNYLTASCKVSVGKEGHKNGSQIPIGNLKLSPRLVYESGGEIEDEDEIFNVLNVEPKTITSTNETFTVNFRIEKVSRRKDGKRFRVRFDFNDKNSNLLDYVTASQIRPVTTTAVTVLSKRKSHQVGGGTQSLGSAGPYDIPNEHIEMKNENAFSKEKERSKRKRSTVSHEPTSTRPREQETVNLPIDFLLKLRENMTHLENTVNILSRRLSILEENQLNQAKGDSNSRQQNEGFNRGKRVHSLMFDEAFPNRNKTDTGSPLIFNGTTGAPIKRNGSSTHELFEFLSSSSFLN